MRTTSYSDLRRNLAATLDSVAADHQPVIITRERGKPAAVLMLLEGFASYEETRSLLQSPRNAERLAEAIAELDAVAGASARSAIEDRFQRASVGGCSWPRGAGNGPQRHQVNTNGFVYLVP